MYEGKIIFEIISSQITVLQAPHGKENKFDKNIKYKIIDKT